MGTQSRELTYDLPQISVYSKIKKTFTQMFQSFIYLSKRLFNLSKHLFHESVFLSPLVFLTSGSLLRCYDL